MIGSPAFLDRSAIYSFFGKRERIFINGWFFLRVHLLPGGNPAGIEVNVAYYGFRLITYAVFNYIFLTSFLNQPIKWEMLFSGQLSPLRWLCLSWKSSCIFPIYLAGSNWTRRDGTAVADSRCWCTCLFYLCLFWIQSFSQAVWTGGFIKDKSNERKMPSTSPTPGNMWNHLRRK